MSDESAGVPERRIVRGELEEIIRRAAELSVRASDAEDRLSEADLLRIGEEVGLPARHVLQALHERPELKSDPSLFEALTGSAVVVGNRAVPGDPGTVARQMEAYLTKQEYLRVVRNREGGLLLVPAEDAITSVVRAFTRRGSSHHVSRARRVAVNVHPLEEGASHVRLELDLGAQRKEANVVGGIVGSGLGLGAGGLGAALIAAVAEPGSAVAVAGIIASLASGTAAGFSTGMLLAARSFRRRVRDARMELEGLLDRVERGQRLDGGPAPWRAQLRSRLFGNE